MSDRQARLEAIAEEIRSHRGCGFEPCETCTNPVPGEGSADAEVVLVGEAPGASEDKAGRPFVGNAGRMLDKLLERAGLGREDVFITNILKARPPKNRDPRKDEVAHSFPWLEQQLEAIQPKLIVPLGRHALAKFAPDAKITQVHGTVLDYPGPDLFPMYHPAMALHREEMRDAVYEDAEKLRVALAAL